MLSPSRVLAAQAQSPAQLLMLQMLQSTGSFRYFSTALLAFVHVLGKVFVYPLLDTENLLEQDAQISTCGSSNGRA
jgi:hypothetical protein